ncbi:VOC family protein [Streptomyces pactum]|uniref:Glyoxalase/bleomycin resistance/dioxygenase family protein n=1 Tax=Streptomyces pactum TaxID=68249 RepID=A0A1S6JBX5_9ACTN|nr:VOC family protein [Streptomyces pactum]AQS69254.1 glyoxalase/bleomycin resistance/dioxygenase family protein [Streptomyces pactum]
MAPVARLRSVVVDCPEPRELARFYALLGGGTPEEQDPDWVVLQVPGGPRLSFQRAPGLTPPEWPRSDRNAQQFHLDFDGGATWEEMDAAHEKVLALGARPLDLEDREKKDFMVYADPAGHPFCLCRIEHA